MCKCATPVDTPGQGCTAGLRTRKDIWDIWTPAHFDEMTPTFKLQSLPFPVILPKRTGIPNVLPCAEGWCTAAGVGVEETGLAHLHIYYGTK